jgi:hypothetical protein
LRSRPEIDASADLRANGVTASPKLSRDRLGGVDIIVHVVGWSSAPAGGVAMLGDYGLLILRLAL